MEAFDKAIEDTITAINTGCLRDRDANTLDSAKGKVYLQNSKWREQMDTVVDLLRAIRSRFELGQRMGTIWTDGKRSHCIQDRATYEWMDQTREELLRVFLNVCKEAGVHGPREFDSNKRRRF